MTIHWIGWIEGIHAKMPCDISLIFKCALFTCDLFFFFFGGGGDILLTFSLQFSLYLAEIKLNIMLSAKNIYLPGGFFGNTSWSRITKQCVSFIKQWRNFTSNSCPYLWLACSSELESGLKMLHVFSQPVTFTLESPSPVSPAQCCRISVVAYSNSC